MIMAAATCLAFGLGLPTTAAYILVALLGAPALLEGGADLAATALREEVVDRFLLVLAPTLIGGDGRAVLGPLGLGALAKAPRFRRDRISRLGADLLWEAAVQYRR
jgi:riboflavin biosynthesis pyrimidine reductase